MVMRSEFCHKNNRGSRSSIGFSSRCAAKNLLTHSGNGMDAILARAEEENDSGHAEEKTQEAAQL